MPTYAELNPGYTPPAGARQNEQGYWIDDAGDFTAGEMTPGLWATLQSGSDPRVQWDAQGKPFQIVKGQKDYFSPNALQGSSDPKVAAWLKTVAKPDGGFVHGYEWDSKNGEWASNINAGNLLSAGIGGLAGGELLYAGLAGAGGAGGTAAGGSNAAFDSSGAFVGPTTVTGEVTAPAVAGTSGASAGSLSGLGGEAGTGATTAGTTAATTGAEAGTGATAGEAGAFDAAGNFTGTTTVAGEAGSSMGGWASLAKQWAPEIIGGATSLIGTKMAADANSEAARIQAESAAKALQWQKDLFGQERTDLGPYRGTGYFALGRLTGQDPRALTQYAETVAPLAPNLRATAATQPPQAGTSQPPATGAFAGARNALQGNLAAQQGGQMVTVKAPDGEVRRLPSDRAMEAVRLGGQIVYGGQ